MCSNLSNKDRFRLKEYQDYAELYGDVELYEEESPFVQEVTKEPYSGPDPQDFVEFDDSDFLATPPAQCLPLTFECHVFSLVCYNLSLLSRLRH